MRGGFVEPGCVRSEGREEGGKEDGWDDLREWEGRK